MRRSGVAQGGGRQRSRARRVEGAVGAAAILAAVAIGFATRNTAPDDYGEESAPATGPVPVVATGGTSGPVTLPSYPLVVGDGLRVTGHESGVAAHPVSAPGDEPAHWRYDRPDDELVGLALAGAPAEGGPVVVSLWEDGLLTGVDALTGEPRWRVVVDETLLATRQFDPVDVVEGGLLKVVEAGGGDVVAVQVEDVLVGVDAAGGAELWRRDEGLCRDAPAPLDGSSWWTIGGHVAVDATCPAPDGLGATVRLVDPRTGEVADEVASQPPWQPLGSGDASAVVPVGCRPDLTGCSLIEHAGTGSLSDEQPIRWAVQGGRLVEAARTDAAGIEARLDGGFELLAVDRATGELAWTATGQAYDLGRPQFHDADAGGEDVWVASHSWEGGPPGLVRLSPADGSVTGCLAPPTDGPPTQVRVADGHIVVSDFPWGRDTAYDPEAPDGAVRMLVPDPAPTCAAAG
ncbi:MAG TPA: PQQ-binding-like beta-propeller repeat protein [Acidimicrobiales bacterium]